METIRDPGLARQLTRQGRTIHLQALLAALALTALAVLLPG